MAEVTLMLQERAMESARAVPAMNDAAKPAQHAAAPAQAAVSAGATRHVADDRLPSDYDALVRCSPQGSIFAHRWWLEALADAPVEVLEIRRGGGVHAAWPLALRIDRATRHVAMPPLTQKLGILFAPSAAKPVEQQSSRQRLVAELIDRLGAFDTFHQNFHEHFTDWLPFHWRGYAQTTRYTYVLDDIADHDALWLGMRPRHRTTIRKAERLGIRVRDDFALPEFIELNRKTFTRQGRVPLADDARIRRLDAALEAHAGRRIFAGVDGQGRVHAAVYVAWADGTAYYLMGGSEPDLRESGAQLLALWDAIRFAGSVARRFDFEGSMLPQVEQSFRGFGARQAPYFSISKVPPPPSSLSGFVKAAVKFRIGRLQRLLQGRG